MLLKTVDFAVHYAKVGSTAKLTAEFPNIVIERATSNNPMK